MGFSSLIAYYLTCGHDALSVAQYIYMESQFFKIFNIDIYCLCPYD